MKCFKDNWKMAVTNKEIIVAHDLLSWPSSESPFRPNGDHQTGLVVQGSWVHFELLGDLRNNCNWKWGPLIYTTSIQVGNRHVHRRQQEADEAHVRLAHPGGGRGRRKCSGMTQSMQLANTSVREEKHQSFLGLDTISRGNLAYVVLCSKLTYSPMRNPFSSQFLLLGNGEGLRSIFDGCVKEYTNA